MISQLSDWLVKLTGYDAVCMQPNSGAQGNTRGCWRFVTITKAATKVIAISA